MSQTLAAAVSGSLGSDSVPRVQGIDLPVLSEKGVTLLMTNELEDRANELRFSPIGSAFLVDAIVMQRFVEADAELHTVISVIKVRGSSHSRMKKREPQICSGWPA